LSDLKLPLAQAQRKLTLSRLADLSANGSEGLLWALLTKVEDAAVICTDRSKRSAGV